ncbi:phage protease [Paracoccus sp. (in: a-proteobacteria)]|uniref:phage protease n=1 Tax=Paracoccus sp. TaxID=267 RepID=UPI0028A8F03A|nr:phage protease [Paracoccus sp. (in: a-proteobacteria)]
MTQIVRNICAFAPEPIDPAADWIEIMPVGEFRTADGRSAKPFRLDPADVAAVIARSMTLASNGELLIDFDHRSMAPQAIADTRAAGWIKNLKLEGERVMASVVWTPDGRAALEGRSYRFISPVFDNLKSDGRVVRIQGAGLVNDPALPQLRQLASKDNSSMEPIEQIAGLLGLPADKPEDIVARVTALATSETQLASITTAAGISGDDAVTQICARLTATTPDPGAFVPMATFQEVQTQLASLQKDIGKDKAEAALDRARDAGKLTPAMEEWATQLASKDLASFESWAASAPVMVELGGRRLAGKQPPASNPDKLTDVERQMASAMGVSEEAFLATRNAEQKGA